MTFSVFVLAEKSCVCLRRTFFKVCRLRGAVRTKSTGHGCFSLLLHPFFVLHYSLLLLLVSAQRWRCFIEVSLNRSLFDLWIAVITEGVGCCEICCRWLIIAEGFWVARSLTVAISFCQCCICFCVITGGARSLLGWGGLGLVMGGAGLPSCSIMFPWQKTYLAPITPGEKIV